LLLEDIQEIWIRYVGEKGQFGIKATDYYGQEKIVYAGEVNLSSIFPAKPRPGVTKMNISTQGIRMKVSQPFVISGDMEGNSLELRLHHQK
jgi:hypothetical protein